MKQKEVKIAILDSGVNCTHEKFVNKKIKGKTIVIDEKEDLHLSEAFDDEIGHGTAVYDIISSLAPQVDITNFKILSRDLTIKTSAFIKILQYIMDSNIYDIINISITTPEYSDEMKQVCDEIIKRGTVIVSAFDNYGGISYPAAFESVIGVDISNDVINMNQYEYVEGSVVNVRGYAGPYRVAWTTPSYILVKGSSYACAYISSQIANYICSGNKNPRELLNEYSCKQFSFRRIEWPSMPFQLNNAILFPFNKEIHALVRFSDFLDFRIQAVCDYKYSGFVGASTASILGDVHENYIIQDVFKADFASADTIVIGHIAKYMSLVDREKFEQVIQLAVKHDLNIYSFDDLDMLNIKACKGYGKLFVPKVGRENVARNFGKLYEYSQPIVCVVGTSSKQGKFSLQLILRNKLLDYGYDVGQIGTEPSSLLFGMDYVFPTGYRNFLAIDNWDVGTCVNEMVSLLCEERKDIILTGLQSGILPYNKQNINFYPFIQQAYLQTVNPDAIVLCINPDDDSDHIEDCIKYCESVTEGAVMAIVCFPMELKTNWRGMLGALDVLKKERYQEIKESLALRFKIPVYLLGESEDMDFLVNDIIEFFSE